ncbi:hypothetical protein EC988_009730, partial [Linderina pennispora]
MSALPSNTSQIIRSSPIEEKGIQLPGMPDYGGFPYGQDVGMPGQIQIIAPPPQFRRFGNAAALGLITFGICTVQESMMVAG